MKVECPNCHKAYDIPDERLPMGQEIEFPCPDCKGTIKLDLRSKSAQDRNPSSQPEQEKQPNPSSAKEQLSGEALKDRILRSVADLPPMPQTIFKVREIIADPSSTMKELAQILETDQAMATKVLKLANSAYYGLIGKVSSIQHASVVLGQKTVGELMTMVATSSLLGKTLEGYGLDSGDLWRHSLGVAFGSKIISNKKNPALANDAFTAGLIHDAGKIILDKYVLERQEAFQEFMANGQQSFLAAEKEILGFDHSQIVSEVCKSWNVPETLARAIGHHHYPSQSEGDELAYVVHTADAIAMMTGLGLGIDGMSYEMDDKALESLDLQEAEVSSIMGEVSEAVQKIAEQMQQG
jgi:HD-like signal output (HDOD) protein